MNNRIKIGFIEFIGGHGGMEFYDFGFCNGLYSNNFDVFFFTCNATTLDMAFKCDYPVYKCFKDIYRPYNIFFRGLRFLFGLFSTVSILKLNKVKITHINFFTYSFAEILTVFILGFFNFKIVATIHDIENLSSSNQKFNRKLFIILNYLII